ncbi:hypothetical protein VNO80_22505 [Phaseolus coccineus]|uniref:Uncharacterized protein n=1 Tax=Phaseolus coccineus TaxID=3886 RepID=A0AAN9QUY6_PHACN
MMGSGTFCIDGFVPVEIPLFFSLWYLFPVASLKNLNGWKPELTNWGSCMDLLEEKLEWMEARINKLGLMQDKIERLEVSWKKEASKFNEEGIGTKFEHENFNQRGKFYETRLESDYDQHGLDEYLMVVKKADL